MRKMTDLLKGVRVLELTWAWAGPLAGRTLGDFGADVIKIEGPGRPDGVRFGNYPENDPGEEPWNRGAHFQKHSRNKKSLILDLNQEAGRKIFLDLIRETDVFVENNSPRVLPNFGLTWEALHAVNPKLVMCAMPGFGNSGPLRDWLGFGINLEAYCGLSSVTGYADGGPVRSVIPYGDPIAGLHAVVAMLAALRHARRTGEGQFIEVAQDESLINVLVEPFFRRTHAGEGLHPDGGHHEIMSPHGIYQTSGRDEWLTLAVENNEQFAALVSLIGKPEWTSDPQLQTAEGRKAREGKLDEAIAAWAAGRERHAAAAELNAAGVPAAPALRVDEIFEHETLKDRRYWTEFEHPQTGLRPYAYLPFNLWRSEPATPFHAPLFGEHNREILQGRLGLSDEQLAELEAQNVIATRPNMA